MSIKHEVRRQLWKLGCDLCRFEPRSHPIARTRMLLKAYGIDTVLDIGANAGQFAEKLRHDVGYTKRIISFEPQSAAFEMLKRKAGKDSSWEALNIAIGDIDEQKEINVAGNSYSSSFLDMLPTHSGSSPQSAYVAKERVEVKRLDAIFETLCRSSCTVYMKVDTQGFESRVLKGAEASLQRIDTVQMEMSLVPLYGGEALFDEIYGLMKHKGYALVSIEPGFSDPRSGQLLQVDGTFHRFPTGKAG